MKGRFDVNNKLLQLVFVIRLRLLHPRRSL